jgi:hypothetical protein
MKISIIGSIKIDSRHRKKLFVHSLQSLKPISSLLCWRLNIIGKYADFARKNILNSYGDSVITVDDATSNYELLKDQIQKSESNIILFWQEDHWFLCPNKNLFLYLLQKFIESKAEILTISHLTISWEAKCLLPVVSDKYLYKEYLVNLTSQQEIWKRWPEAYLTGIPAIYKRNIAIEILEITKPLLENSNKPGGYELYGKKAREFLQKRSFIEMIPTFQVFREVFRFNKEERAIDMKKALQIIKLRDDGSF